MARLTYDIFKGELTVVPHNAKNKGIIIATALSGFSNDALHSGVVQLGKHGDKEGYQPGGPIPPGVWAVHPPGSRHPDGGRRRANWIPIGPVNGRTYIYIHPAGTRTEGCIAVADPTKYALIVELLTKEKGGAIHVLSGAPTVKVGSVTV